MTLRRGLPVLLLWCSGCASGFFITNGTPDAPHPLPPSVVPDEPPGKVGYRGEVSDLSIPPGDLPPPGQCRIWHPGKTPADQPPPGDCAQLEKELPAGSWLVSRPANDDGHVLVKICDASMPAAVIMVRTYEAESGRFVREERP